MPLFNLQQFRPLYFSVGSLVVVFLIFFSFSAELLTASHAYAGEWSAHEANLKTQIVRIREKEKKIRELIEEKKKTRNKDDVEKLLGEIQKEHKELTKIYKEFDQEREHVRFEHPEHGDKTDRKYQAYKLKSLDDFEQEGGIDGKLNKTKIKMLERYGVPLSEATKKKQAEIAKPSPTADPNRIKLQY